MRKGTKKQKGDSAILQLTIDREEFQLNEELIACLKEDKKAKRNLINCSALIKTIILSGLIRLKPSKQNKSALPNVYLLLLIIWIMVKC